MSLRPVKILVVDDSAVIRGLMAKVIESTEGLQLAGTAMHGEAALAFLKRNPVDIVVLDVEMPVMNGLDALRQIQIQFPGTHVIMASALTTAGAKVTVEALAQGAAGCVAKPQAKSASDAIQQVGAELVPLIRALTNKPEANGPDGAIVTEAENRSHSETNVPRTNIAYPTPLKADTATRSTGSSVLRRMPRPVQAIVIGTSTGGPKALSQIMSSIDDTIWQPILIVQHMPAAFTPMLAKHLGSDSRRVCVEAQTGMPILPRQIYVAPGDYHLEVVRKGADIVAQLHQAAPEHYCRPSVNPLFRTAADVWGKHLAAVMLTGMGDDGIEGTQAVHQAGGYILAQDAVSSVVWGMPGAVVKAGLHDEMLSLSEIAGRLRQIALWKGAA